jgi:DNA repair exonuclease SbcCD nuclease subunit
MAMDSGTVRIAHSSDLHIDTGAEELSVLRSVLAAAREADLLVLAGDVFEHNRLPLKLIDQAARLLADAGLPVVILPGNHDCLGYNSIYVRGGLGDPENVSVLGVTNGETLHFPSLDLSIWGRPHHDYQDMAPLAESPNRLAGRHIAVAHGHLHLSPEDQDRSWLIREDDLAALDADYVALGHWDRPVRARGRHPHAYYSGSPQFAGTMNLVDIDAAGEVTVERTPLTGNATQPNS